MDGGWRMRRERGVRWGEMGGLCGEGMGVLLSVDAVVG